ncbi:MAG: deoxyribonuclease IV [Planctomycetes bacterium]|nr:deoxyribonuclease IV [Planctomycetota bacterium]
MPLLGAHMSIAGGLHKALERGHDVRCDTIQIFTRPNVNWRAKEISVDDVRLFEKAQRETGIDLAVAHDCYLINLCSTNETTYRRSMAALEDEVRRADVLGLPYLIMHPGAHGGRGESEGLKRIADALTTIHAHTKNANVKILLETTAGMGTVLGYRFEQLREIIEETKDGERRLGVCYDTCHTFAAGYDLRTRKGYRQVMQEFDRVIGLDYLRAIHLNDSKGDLGSRLDRHEHIGRGKLGLNAFRHLLNDPRFANHPMYLETPKGKSYYWDRRNLGTLRRLVQE